MKKEDIEGKELKKHVAAIRVSNTVGALGRKVWNVLLINAYDDLLEKRKHTIPVSVLSDVAGYNSKSYDSLKSALQRLQTTLVEWDIGGGAAVKGMWSPNHISVQMIGGYKIENGILEYYYPDYLPELLYQPTMYQSISLSQQKEISSGASLALWENCLRYIGVGSTGLSDVEEWKVLLGVQGKKAYQQFYRFNERCLSLAIKEVNKKTNIDIELITERVGRKVVKMGFKVTEKAQQSLFSERLENLKITSEYEGLLSFGIHKVQALEWLDKHGCVYIRQKLNILKESQAQKEIKNPSGFLVKAIHADYQSANEMAKAKEVERKKKELAEKRRKEAKEKLQSEYEKYKKHTTENFWESFSASIKTMVLRDFETKLDHITLQAYKKYGLESAMVLSNFRNFLREEHMQNGQILSFQDWKKKQKTKA